MCVSITNLTNLVIRNACWAILIAGSNALPAFAQNSVGDGACAVHGHVAAQTMGAPLSGASLELISVRKEPAASGSSSNVHAGPGSNTVESGEDGSFCFRTVAPGAYFLTATKAGFSAFHYGAKNYLQSGSIVVPSQGGVSEDLKLALRQPGSIEGTVTDADGDPIPNVNVIALKQTWLNGSRVLTPVSETTDDRGHYRVPLLEPAKYFIYAEPRNESSSWGAESSNREASSPPPVPSALRNVRTYYPDASSLNASMALALAEGGAVHGADIRLIKAKTVHVKGRAAGGDLRLGGKVTLALSGEESNPLVYADADLAADGSFDIPEVSPGDYTLTVSSHIGAGAVQVEVSSSDVSVSAPVVGNSKLQGEIRVDGEGDKSKAPAPEATVALIGLDTLHGLTYPAKIDSAGRFLIDPVRPGKYYVAVSPTTGLYVKSLTAGDMELADGELDLTNGAPVALTIVLKQGRASVMGSIDSGSRDGGDAQPLQILLVPSPYRRTSRVYADFADSSGHFSIQQVPPGKYRALAVEPLQLSALSTPGLADKIAALGQEVDLNESEIKTISLDAVTSDAIESLVPNGSF